MATLKQAAEFAEHPDAIQVIHAAMVKAAVSIMNEEESTPNHGNRAVLAHSVITRPNAHIQSFAWTVSTNPTIVDKWVSGDREGAASDLDFVMGSLWDAIAGKPAPAPEPDPI